MKNFLLRFKFAWYAFWLMPFTVKYKPFHITHLANGTFECDNQRRVNKCPNRTEVFVNETFVKLSIENGWQYIVCKDCANEMIKTGKEFLFEWEL